MHLNRSSKPELFTFEPVPVMVILPWLTMPGSTALLPLAR